jgi:hypothetical protein
VRRLRLVLLLATLSGAGGCIEVEESWELEADGSGVFALRVSWDEDLWQRAGGVLGPEALARFEGRDFPLDPAAWQESLALLSGVTVAGPEEEEAEGGWRAIRVRLGFRRLEDLLAWELLQRRRLTLALVRREPVGEEDGRAREGDLARLSMSPFTRLPVLDPVLRAAAAFDASDPRSPEAIARREPSALERLGLRRDQAGLVAAFLRPRLEEVRLRVRVRPPGPVVEVGGIAVPDLGEATLELDLAAMMSGVSRTLDAVWRPRLLDRVPTIDQPGDEPLPGQPR